MARGAFPDDHPLCLGMPGMHGNYTAVTAMQQADLLIALGTRFDDRVTGKVDGFAPDAKIIHVDIDPAEQGKVRRPDVPIVGDCRLVIEELVEAIRDLPSPRPPARPHAPGSSRISRLAGAVPAAPTSRPSRASRSSRSSVLETLRDSTPDDTILVSGVGQHQMWASRSTGSSTSPTPGSTPAASARWASAVPAAIGAKVGRPDRTVWAVDGDGCFQMTAQELVTASTERIPIKVAILNNAYLGMVRQWQEMFYDERYSEVYLSPDLPDYVKWAEAMGCVGIRVESPEEVQPAIDKANEIDDRPVVVDFRTDAREKVFPMVPAGAVQRRRRRAPALAGATSGGRSVPVMAHRVRRTTSCPCWSRTRPACWPGSSGLFARRGFNIFSLAVAPTDDERFSRITIVVDVESTSLEQITKQLFKLIDVVKITELTPGDVGRARAAARHRARPTRTRRGQVIELVEVFEGKILAVGHDAAHRHARRASPASSTTSRSSCDPMASSSCSAPAGWRCPSWTARRARLRRHGKGELTRWPQPCTTRRTPTRSLIAGRKVAIIGYGSQGHAHALNLQGLRRRRARRPARGLVVGGQGRGRRAAGARRSPRPPRRPTSIMILLPDTEQKADLRGRRSPRT